MTHPNPPALRERLDGLRTELIDLAFVLECQGRRDAADMAMTVSARVAEICDELTGIETPGIVSRHVRDESAQPLSI